MNYNNNFLNSLLNHIEFPVCIFNKHADLVFYNTYAERFFNFTGTEIGCNLSELPDAYQRASCIVKCIYKNETVTKECVINNMDIYTSTKRLYNDDGETEYIEILYINHKKHMPNDGEDSDSSTDLVLSDDAMKNINETISRIAYFDSTILLIGESGTGKTSLAKYIHQHSERADKPFVTINCGVIPDNLIESELFGYASGAFTSANNKGKPGLVELADGGTLFLDEISSLPYNVQTKFLQFIQEKSFMPVGSLKSKSVDVRIISATNVDLKAFVREKKFREDLYYRLRVVELFIPPLRERTDALNAMIDHFIRYYNKKFNINKAITPQGKNVLKSYNWPGNIRELQYLIERIMITSNSSTITAEEIPPLHNSPEPVNAINNPEPAAKSQPSQEVETYKITGSNFDELVSSFEMDILQKAYDKYGSSYKVGQALNMTQTRAARLLRKYEISKK